MATNMELKKLIDKADVTGINEYIKKEGNVNRFCEEDNTPLLYAIEKLSLKKPIECGKIVLLLICGGADVNVKNSKNRTPLKLALKNKLDDNVIRELLNAGAAINGEFKHTGDSPLSYALQYGVNKSIIGELISKGANVNFVGSFERTPLFYVHDYDDNFEVATMLLDAGADVNALDYQARNVLFGICCDNKCGRDNCKRNKKLIDLLLDKGADIKQIDNEGRSIMHYTNRIKCNYLINFYFKSGLCVDVKDNYGKTPLMYAVENRHSMVGGLYPFNADVKSLLYLFNADVNCVDNEINTALHHAAEHGFNHSCDLLLYFGSDIFARNAKNLTPLHRASFKIGHTIVNEFGLFPYSYIFHRFYDMSIIKYYLLYIGENCFFSDYFINNGDCFINNAMTFKHNCLKEVDKLKNTFLKETLTFYDFMVLNRFFNNKTFIDMSLDGDDIAQIKECFPLYYNSIILRVKDNQMEYNKRRLMRAVENIVIGALPCNESVMENVNLIYDCNYLICHYLDYNHLYNLFLASVD